MNNYPEVVIVLVTSHGTIKINSKTNEPYSFPMPDNMSMTILNAVAPGVCNFLKADDADNFAKKIIDKIKDVEDENLLQNNPDAFVNSLVDILKNYDIEMKKDINYNLSIKDEQHDVDEQEYLRHYNKSYETQKILSPDNVIDKEYSRNNATEKNDSDWNFKINVMNVIGFPELIEILNGRSTQNENTYVRLEEIVNYLKTQGVKHIILFDLSCSSFISMTPPKEDNLIDIDDDSYEEENIKDQRLTRRIRRDIQQSTTKKNGGKRMQTQKQTRKKRNQSLKKSTRKRKRSRNQSRRRKQYRH